MLRLQRINEQIYISSKSWDDNDREKYEVILNVNARKPGDEVSEQAEFQILQNVLTDAGVKFELE